jgi:hypothetical protein
MQNMRVSTWTETGGPNKKFVKWILGGLAPEGGAAVVLNARAGVEVEEMRKAGMKVVGMFSEG